jgi:hypothetical protein
MMMPPAGPPSLPIYAFVFAMCFCSVLEVYSSHGMLDNFDDTASICFFGVDLGRGKG